MSATYSASSGGGMPPVDFAKDADGNIAVHPTFSGTVLSKTAARDLAKWLISKPEDSSDAETEGEG